MYKDFLLDKDFLTKVDLSKNKEIWAKIIALDLHDNPLDEITGHVTSGGSINVDGTSSIRRSCSLTINSNKLENTSDYYWGLKTKFQLEIGLTNNIDEKYPKIIWFPQGVYYITSFSTSRSTNNFSINLQGKDKMCMLNGEFGGTISAISQDFDIEEIVNEKGEMISKEKVPIKRIIQAGVHSFGHEPLNNIIINDLDDYGLVQLDYYYDEPLYVIIDEVTNVPETIYFDSNTVWTIVDKNNNELNVTKKFSDLDFKFNKYNDFYNIGVKSDYDLIRYGSKPCSVIKIEYGQTAGYGVTPLIYPEELVGKVGEAFTNILDKIVQFLGNFEYFYDIDGKFIFQKKKTYINQTWNPLKQDGNETYVDTSISLPLGYEFEGSNLITSFSNTPDFAKLKNDFVIWGTNSSQKPFHLRYVINKRPNYYVTFPRDIGQGSSNKQQVLFIYDETKKDYEESETLTDVGNNKQLLTKYCDWREIIYQMAFDYRQYHLEDDFYYMLERNNLIILNNDWHNDYRLGKTGYEQYYEDMWGFWRETYNPFPSKLEDFILESVPTLTKPVKEISIPEDKSDSIVCIKNPFRIVEENDYPFRNSSNTYRITWNKDKEDFVVWPFLTEEFCSFKAAAQRAKNQEEANEIIKNKKLNLVPFFYEDDNGKKQYVTLDWGKAIFDSSYQYGNWERMWVKKFKNFTVNNMGVISPDVDKNNKIIYEEIFEKWSDFWLRYLLKFDKVRTDGSYWTCYIEENEEKSLINIEDIKNNSYITNEGNVKWEPQDTNSVLEPLYYRNWQYQYKYSLHKDNTYKAIEYVYKIPKFLNRKEGCWNRNVKYNPSDLIFWFEFLDTEGEIAQYSVASVGDRVKTLNEATIKAIYYREIPGIIFVEDLPNEVFIKTGYQYLQVPTGFYSKLFKTSSQYKSAIDVAEECLYNDAYCIQAVSMNSIPIYYLQPNTEIYIRDDDSKINGKYVVSRLSIPIGHTGNMSITATKIANKLY